MIPQSNPQRSIQKSKPKPVSLFVGSESDSDPSLSTRLNRLNALRRGRAGACISRWIQIARPRLRTSSPTLFFHSRWIKIGRRPVVVSLALARARVSAEPWQREWGRHSALSHPRPRQRLGALNAQRATAPWVSGSPAPIPSRGHGGSEDPR